MINTNAGARTKVTILTRSYRIKGYVDLIPGSRLTDFMDECKDFIAITDAEVMEPPLGGREILNTAFLNVSRDSIEIITPAP